MNQGIRAALITMLCGAAIMLAWDILHGLRHSFFRGVFANFLLDTVWWVFAASGFIGCTWYANHMDLRAFIWASLFIGAVLYHIILSGAVRLLFCGIFDIFFKIIKFIFKILLTPAVFLYKILLVPFAGICKHILKRGGSR
ncbi:MAG: spore cortex biosynthesis protein YabQ [Clostridiales bacterium]|nr:spore cortex biosynthesis protein YabQ [Clostridiales bacterium]